MPPITSRSSFSACQTSQQLICWQTSKECSHHATTKYHQQHKSSKHTIGINFSHQWMDLWTIYVTGWSLYAHFPKPNLRNNINNLSQWSQLVVHRTYQGGGETLCFFLNFHCEMFNKWCFAASWVDQRTFFSCFYDTWSFAALLMKLLTYLVMIHWK